MNGALAGIALGLAVGVPLLLATLWATARLSGWAALARHYAWDGEPQGPRWGWMSVGFGWLAWYKHCLTVTATPRGLSLRLHPWVRFFHPSLLIPWERITAAERSGSGPIAGVALRVDPPGARLTFTPRHYARMREALPARLRL